MAKENRRSFRFSDEVDAMIAKFPKGNSLNEKFENMVMYCYWELPKLEKAITAKNKEIAQLNKEIEQLRQKKREEAMEFDSLQNAKQQLSAAITKVTMSVFDYREKLDKAIQKDLAGQPVL
ncbi:hypothetical protein V6615_16325 (plasmid) [Oscillospiraceae bacterium PP1C4]